MNRYPLQLLLNKCLTAIPLVLLVGIDAGRETEFDIAIGATICLAVVLTWVEKYYLRRTTFWRMFAMSASGLAVSVVIYAIELVMLDHLGKLAGPVGAYGIASVTAIVSICMLACSILCVWSDSRAKQESVSRDGSAPANGEVS